MPELVNLEEIACGHFSQCLILPALVAAVGTFYFYLLATTRNKH